MPSGVTDEEVPLRGPSPKLEPASSAEGSGKKENGAENHEGRRPSGQEDEGVEVVLGDRGKAMVVESPPKGRPAPNQNVFRHPHPVRPHPMRAHHGPPPPPPPHPYVHGSGSWGYGPPHYPPPPHHPHEYGPPRPYPVPPYASSGSFEDKGVYHHPTPHYSPHVHYPPPTARYSEEVNVISPNHKSDHPHYRPSMPARPRQMYLPHPHAYYQYPPASPVSRPGASGGPPGPTRMRNYSVRRPDGPYSKAQRGDKKDWNSYPSPQRSGSGDMSRRQPPLVTESSFDSEQQHGRRSHPPTPGGPIAPPPPTSSDPHYQFYGGGSWNSFDSAAGAPPPPHFEDPRYYNAPPESPYSTYMAPYSPGGLYQAESFPPPYGYGPTGSFSYSYDDEDRLLKDYHPDRDGETSSRLKHVTPPSSKSKSRSKNDYQTASNMLLPKAAEEVDFDVTDPPAEPVTPPSNEAICESMSDVNSYDVLCGRGGGTNSQIGNRRFRKLVQEFQPTYLLARRKEKPLLARTIVLIIRKRGGRFLRKDDDTGALYEVGDTKAEAKTSQALREGLDVRATKSVASILEKKKNKQADDDDDDDDLDEQLSPTPSASSKSRKAGDRSPSGKRETDPPGSPPSLPRLQGEEVKSPSMSPEQSMHMRKRRRMRGSSSHGMPSTPTTPHSGGAPPPQADRFFPDFCPPRAEFGRPMSPNSAGDQVMPMHLSTTPIRRNKSRDDGIHEDVEDAIQSQGCTGIALDMVTGAATGSFCLGPGGWRGRTAND